MDELCLIYIGNLIDLGADAPGFRIRKGIIHKGKDLTGLVQILNHYIHIINQTAKAAHDQKTGHRNYHCSQRHKAVEENTTDAFLDQIAKICYFHIL